MRAWVAAMFVLVGCVARAEKILLIPLDSRPAAGQFAQMIGRMASVEVILPPYELLGRFTESGKPDLILDWLRDYSFRDVSAVIVSTDMVAYGGLIQSRVDDTSLQQAKARIKRLNIIRHRNPKIKFYGFSAIMRLFPTSTRANASWRQNLGRLAEMKERMSRTGDGSLRQRVNALEAKIPPVEIERYVQTRIRNVEIQNQILNLTKQGLFDYMIFGQDDAQPYGPHITEQKTLRNWIREMDLIGNVYMCEGIDQHANVLLSRALLRKSGWTPRVRIVYSDESGRFKIANYESKNIQASLNDQIFASGARPMAPGGTYDYTLYLNTPEPADQPFGNFLRSLDEEIDQGFPVAVADINLGKDGTGDSRLFDTLWRNGRVVKLLSYAGWNTAGNTMGTSIPTANIYLLSRRLNVDPVERELTQREFLLHRYVNDFIYHKLIRPAAYDIIDELPNASREETYGDEFEQVNGFVREGLSAQLKRIFEEQFLGKTFFAGSEQYAIQSIDQIKVFLPWPRAYEVRLEFRMRPQRAGITPVPAVAK